MNNNNLIVAIVLSVLILVGFQYFYAGPQQKLAQQQQQQRVLAQKQAEVSAPQAAPVVQRDRASILAENTRVPVRSPELSGSIDPKGARIDDLSLVQYHESLDDKTPVVLLSPAGSAPPHRATYAEFSWLSADTSLSLPGADTVWKAEGAELSPAHPLRLTWNNGQGLAFERMITVDEHYMFTLADRVSNAGAQPVTLYPFGLVTRQGAPVTPSSTILHEGPLGVVGGTLEEIKYKKLAEEGKKSADSEGGWLGLTDKYWLVAIAPSQDEKVTASFTYDGEKTAPYPGRYQSDFRGNAVTIPPGGFAEHVTHLFAGAKRVKLLDQYEDKYGLPHFDRAIDFGWFYFLTKPFLYMLDFLGRSLGSLGIAILVFTVMLKLITLPLSLKSNHSMARMKELQPEIKRIQERCGDDKLKQNQEMMELFKREKVSPMSGCVPMLIQIPIFFALYKILYVGIELRQAPFYGWIHDMAAPDPTSTLTLFGALPWTPPEALHIGAWPILMGISMFLQQRLSPQPPDKTQARMFMIMPVLFTYMLAHMPAGLVIYWTWSNLLSIGQQWFIMRMDAKRKKAAA